jgi:hypothetical protein
MTKEASAANPSVPLHEVLEAEFAVLHGELPSDYPGSSDPNNRMLGAHTMEKLSSDCAGDFRRFTGDILRTHLQTQPPDWLATLIQMSATGRDATGPA